MRFHQLHGKNIFLDEQRLVATRVRSFSHGMIFSERELYPGEFFIVEIEDITEKWTGHIKVGFTQMSPEKILNQCQDDVIYDDVIHITVPSKPINRCVCTCGLYQPLFNMNGIDEYIHTPFASIRRQTIEPVRKDDDHTNRISSTNIGSRVGIVYAVKEKSIQMHCILNGHDYGPFSLLKSDKMIDEQTKFWAFIDVYGATKRVRILQLYGPSTLKSLCRSVILSSLHSSAQVNQLSFLHNQLKSYLNFSTN